VAGDIARQCQLRFQDVGSAPKFSFDDFQLLPDDRAALQEVAHCLTDGPLKDHAVSLTGRADPRGTEEYNLGLGTRRAEIVAGYLLHLGVPSSQVSSSTRGALDATGRDDTGWQVDRRVDLALSAR
jgi:peptidoglycan-associated lipoprotein